MTFLLSIVKSRINNDAEPRLHCNPPHVGRFSTGTSTSLSGSTFSSKLWKVFLALSPTRRSLVQSPYYWGIGLDLDCRLSQSVHEDPETL